MKRSARPRRGFFRVVRRLAAVLWLLALAPSAAQADAAAGRAAFERGDYKAAMTEWQSAADHNDPEAEFGLGSLYELGAGDLKQDYKKADYWYGRAAEHGNVEAQYRLALIWAVGGDDLAADLTNAYQWVLLAAESKGVWGTLAADLKSQLDKVTIAGQRAEAERRAAAWKQARAAAKEEAAAASAPAPQALAPQAPAPANKTGATGCPGWPFPTLPCTEQFPPLPGVQAQPRQPAPPRRAGKTPLEELDEAMAQIDCASLRSRPSAQGSASISGTVPDAAQKAKLVQLAAHLFPNGQPDVAVEIVPPPLCHSLAEFQAMRAMGLIGEGEIGLRLNGGSAQLREGDPIKLEIRAPAFPIDLRIDYFSLDGRVLHLKPQSGEPAAKLAAGSTRLFGNPAMGEVWNAGGAPFGTEVITVIATPAPLDLGEARPTVELAADYLRDLKLALSRAGNPSSTPNAMAILLVKTGPRRSL